MSSETETNETVEAPEQVEPVEAPEREEEPTEGTEDAEHDEQEEPQTFPAHVVKALRKENAKYRDRAKASDDLRAALWEARVAATGRLADPTDLALPEDGDPLDAEQVDAAVDALLEAKPHLAARRVAGSVGQGRTGSTNETVDLAGILRARA